MIMEGRSFSGRERNCCFLNTGEPRFATISAISGLDFPDDGRALAVSDWDHDGDLDLWTSNRNGPRLRFMRNDTPSNSHFLSIRLIGDGQSSNRDAIGARVKVTVQQASGDNESPRAMIKTLRAGEGFLSQSSKWVHFGLGDADTIQDVTVYWPGGQPQTFEDLQVNGRYRLRQSEASAEAVTARSAVPAVRPGAQERPEPTRAARIMLETRVPMPSVRYASPNESATVEEFGGGAPTIVNLWASWCSPCVEELRQLTASQAELRQANLRVVSLSVDRVGSGPTSDEARELLERLEYPFDWGFVSGSEIELLQELHQQFFFLRRPLPLPTSFLIDADGNLAAIYRGPVTVSQLLDDIRDVSEDPLDGAIVAARLPGRSIDHPRVRQVAERTERLTRYRVASWLETAGRNDDALRHFVQMNQRNPSWALPERRLAQIYLDRRQFNEASAHVNRALKLDSKDADAHNLAGLVKSGQGDPQGAEAHFRQATKLAPQLAGPFNNLGIVLAMQGKMTMAGQCFQQAVQLDDEFAEAHTNLGNIYAARNNAQHAISHYQRAIQIDPKYIDAYNNLGTLFGRLGDIQQAVEYYRRALQIDPSNADAQRNLERARQVLNSRR